MRVLLVDDEAIEREGLRDYVAWDKLGLEVSGEASDGILALKIVAQIKPEIVITDIKMPGVDGIELAARMKEISPYTKVILISGYQEFEYARKAITLNAAGYVLKPVNFDKLFELLSSLICQIREEQYGARQKEELRKQIEENRYYLQRQFLLELLLYDKKSGKDALYKRADYLGISFPYDFFGVAVVTIDDYKECGSILTEEGKQFLNTITLNLMKEISVPDSRLDIVQILDGTFAVIINAAKNDNAFKNEIVAAFEDFLQCFTVSCAETATVGISNFRSRIEDLYILYDYALSATKAKWTLGKSQVIFASDISICPPSVLDIQNYSEPLHEISQYVLAGDEKSAKEAICGFFDNVKDNKACTPQSIRNLCLTLVEDFRRILTETEDDPEALLGTYLDIYNTVIGMETMTGLESWLSKILDRVLLRIQEKRKAKNNRLAGGVMEIINSRYHENIGVEGIADEMHFSSNYIRKIFKDETGHTISDYLFQVRMKRAVELMRNPELRVYDIGKKVGYENTSYFCQVFKQHYGITPKEFKDSLSR